MDRMNERRRFRADTRWIVRIIAVAVLLGLPGCAHHLGTGTASLSSEKSSTATKTARNAEELNKELVLTFFQRFSRGEIDQAFSMVSDDVRWWVAGDLPFSGTKSKAEYLQVVDSIQQGFPDGLQLEVTSMIAEENKVAAEVASHGEHANGKNYKNLYHFLVTVGDGKMTSVNEYMDTLHLHELIQP